MVYLLDTNTCVEFLRNRNQRVVQRIQSHPPQDLRLCAVVVGELYYGAYRSPYAAANLALLAKFLPRFLSLPYDDAAAEIFGQVRAQLAATGALIGPYDLQIAAIALANQCTLVTHNTTEFSRIPGLVLEDWQV